MSMRNGRIRIFVLVALLMLTATQAYGKKCKFLYDRIDPLTNEISRANGFYLSMSGGEWWRIELIRIGERYELGAVFRVSGNSREFITPDNMLIFKLGNDEIITLHAKDEYRPRQVVTPNSNMIFSEFSSRYTISIEDLQKLASIPIVYVKLTYGAKDMEAFSRTNKSGKKWQERVQGQVRCIMQ